MTEHRKKLTDILQGNADREALKKAWQTTDAAAEFAPLPPGEYTLRVLSGELFQAKTGTPGYKLKLQAAEGEYAGRLAWHDLWLTRAALPMTKRDLAKLGIDADDKLERPLPPGILIRARLTVRRDNDGNESNRVRSFEFAGVEKGDAFEPEADQAADRGEPPQADSPAAPPAELFPFGASAPRNGDAAFVAGEKGGGK